MRLLGEVDNGGGENILNPLPFYDHPCAPLDTFLMPQRHTERVSSLFLTAKERN